MDEASSSDLDAMMRRVDPDRWLSSRFVGQPDARADIVALYAFDHELARAPRIASNALLGEMRLTWWREALDEIFEGRPVRHHPAAQALARKRTLTDRDLRAASWVLRERGSGTRQTFERALSGLLPELHVVLELTQTEAIKGAVAAGLGLGCLSHIALADAFRLGTLTPLAVHRRNFRRRLYLVLHRKKFVGAGLRKFLAICASS